MTFSVFRAQEGPPEAGSTQFSSSSISFCQEASKQHAKPERHKATRQKPIVHLLETHERSRRQNYVISSLEANHRRCFLHCTKRVRAWVIAKPGSSASCM